MVLEVFLLVGAVLLLGFVSDLFFKETRIPGYLILMLTGILIGPVFNVVPPELFIPLSSLVGTLALIIILFDAGLDLNITKVLSEVPSSALFTLLVFILSAAFTTGLLYFVFGWNFFHALLMAAVIGGTSSSVVIPVISKLKVSQEVSIMLSLESVVTDVLCIVTALVLINIINTSSFELDQVVQTLTATFTTAILFGFLFGVFWIRILHSFYGKSLGYMLTLAVLLVLYSVVELLGGSGAIGVLIFSLVLGNSTLIANLLKMGSDYKLEHTIKSTQTEITFFVTTFFFVFLGLIISPSVLELGAIGIALGIVFVLVLARFLVTTLLSFFNKAIATSKNLISFMMSRGLAAAVLAFLPLNQNPPIVIPSFSEIVFLVIILTAFLSTYASYSTGRVETKEETPQPAGKPKIISTKKS
ncbi:MAG: cation:proton antiporter [Candidatus Micrarchaeota archaeon]